MSTIPTAFRLDEEIIPLLKKIAKEQDRSVNWLVNNTLKNFIEGKKGNHAVGNAHQIKIERPAKVVEPKNQNYQTCLDIYFTFIKQRTSVKPKMSGGEGKALKELIVYFDSIVFDKEDPQAVPKAFQYLFDNWQRIEPFLQGQLKLMQINSNITNILNQIRNGTPAKESAQDQRMAEWLNR